MTIVMPRFFKDDPGRGLTRESPGRGPGSQGALPAAGILRTTYALPEPDNEGVVLVEKVSIPGKLAVEKVLQVVVGNLLIAQKVP